MRQALTGYAVQSEPDAQIESDYILIRSVLAQRKLAAAQHVLSHDQKLMSDREDRFSRTTVEIASGLVQSFAGKTMGAVKSLEAGIEETKHVGFVALRFEARLALGQLLSQSGEGRARTQLMSLEKDARANGFLLIANKAHTARTNH